MDCNKDEAERAKSIAEKKFEQKDFAGARKFAVKAKTLYPDLDGISQLVTTLEVYVSAENKISGEIDWYGVLSVSPTADDEAVKKQYRKLALALHPDKNKSIGADGAFRLISEAWSLLSDKAKRLAYNQRRGLRIFQQRVATHTAAPSARPPPRANGSFNFTRRPTSAPKSQSQNKAAKAGPSRPTPTPAYQRPHIPPTPSAIPTPRTDTFWTICHQCKMQYEYMKVYCNHTLLCPNCKKPFKATATAPPINISKSRPVNMQGQQNSSSNLPNRNAYKPGRNVPASHKPGTVESGQSSFKYRKSQQGAAPSGTANVDSSGPSVAAKAANYVAQQAADKLKRAFVESHPSAGWDQSSKKRKAGDDSNNPYGMNYSSSQFGMNYNSSSSPSGMNYNMAHANGGFGNATISGFRTYGFSSTNYNNQTNRNRELTAIEAQNMLMARARKEIRKKLSELKSKATAKTSNKEKGKTKESNKDREGNNSNFKEVDNNGKTNLSGKKIARKAETNQASCSVDDESTENPTAVTMTVPDPDFHDFDQDRSESSFGDNEVWAAYDDDDGMPRFYALVSKVISRDPFKLKIAWLNSKTNTEFSTLDWVGSGFYKTCGEFWVGKYETCKFINAFSQRVNWSKTPRGRIVILPQKDDVWALYRNWSSDWNKNTPDEVVHKYDMVIVLDNYSEEKGASVAPLLKVGGFRTVFRPNLELEMIRRIPKEEIFRFSHRVPHHSLTSKEAQNAPDGCLELDPAATPLDLLQMITETNEVAVLPKRENVDAAIDTHVGRVGKGKPICQGDETECVHMVISGQV